MSPTRSGLPHRLAACVICSALLPWQAAATGSAAPAGAACPLPTDGCGVACHWKPAAEPPAKGGPSCHKQAPARAPECGMTRRCDGHQQAMQWLPDPPRLLPAAIGLAGRARTEAALEAEREEPAWLRWPPPSPPPRTLPPV